MAATLFASQIAPENLRWMLLAFGVSNAFRVLSLDEIVHSVGHIRREEVRDSLEQLAEESLVTKFSGRYCFNKAIPPELRRAIERAVTPSGTIRASKAASN